MAKKQTKPQGEAQGEPVTLKYGDFSVPMAELSPTALAYLAQYGFAKSLQDSVAGMKKALQDERDQDGNPIHNDASLAVALHDKQQERFTAILAGTVGVTAHGPRPAPIERVMRTIAQEAIRNAAAASKKPMPKGEALDEVIAKYLAKYGDKTRAEAERRMAFSGENILAELT